MTENFEESKEGLYKVYYQESGKKILVLEGLNAEDIYEPPLIQQFIHQYYAPIEIFYWALFLSVMLYVAGVNIVIPLLRKFNLF